MHRNHVSVILGLSLALCAATAWAQVPHTKDKLIHENTSAKPAAKVVLPEGVTEEMLAPPPVPRFMLEPPSKPLSHDEMAQQIQEAERRSGIKRKPPQP